MDAASANMSCLLSHTDLSPQQPMAKTQPTMTFLDFNLSSEPNPSVPPLEI
ncbi:MAG: hypothetical protein SW833_01890 [Cyanobacteriota bacterium]|nr:hypothetical protein [Cyanobacteriota bacterium]